MHASIVDLGFTVGRTVQFLTTEETGVEIGGN